MKKMNSRYLLVAALLLLAGLMVYGCGNGIDTDPRISTTTTTTTTTTTVAPTTTTTTTSTTTTTQAAPAFTSITPSFGNRGGTISITDLVGTGFRAGATVKLKKAGQTDINATGVVVSSAIKITCGLPLAANTNMGNWDVVVTNDDAQSVSGAGAFTVDAGAPAAIIVTSGSPQSATVATAFSSPLVATVTDADGAPASGATVTFTAPAAGTSGTFADSGTNTTTAITDVSGVATSPTFTANTVAGGPYVVTATSGALTPANFNLTNLAGVPASIVLTSGSPQTAAISTVFSSPLVVTVMDAYSNPLSGVTVTFTAPAAGASGTFAGGTNTTTVTTNVSGVATSSLFTANGIAGSYVVTATTGVLSVDFDLTNQITI